MPFKKGDDYWTGRKHRPESLVKLSESLKGRKAPKSAFKKGVVGESHNRWKGGADRFPVCLKCDKRLSSMKSRNCRKHAFELVRGENHPLWVKDRSKLKRTGDANKDRRSSAYVTWRREVWKRDGYKCKIADSSCCGRIEAHHILGFTEHPTLRYKINNGITLCHAHHPRKKSEEKRLSPYFTELVSVSRKII